MIRHTLSRWLIAGLALVVGSVEGTSQAKAPVPSDAAQAESENLIRQLFAAEFSAASETDGAALGHNLYRQALETEFDLVGRYVLLVLAKDMLEEAGDPAAALAVVRAMARGYLVDDLALEHQILQRAAEREGVDRSFLAEEALILGERAVDRDRFVIASDMEALAAGAGISEQRHQEFADHAQSRREAFREVEEAVRKLAGSPSDPVLNELVGEYRCFIQGRWSDGLPLLAKARNTNLRRIAAADLQDVQGQQQYLVARAWWDLAESRPDQAIMIRKRAIYWYRKCQHTLGGLDRARVVALIRAEVENVVAGATALSEEGLPRLAAYRLSKAVHLDSVTIEDAITALGEPATSEAAAGFGNHAVPELYAGRADGRAKLADKPREAISDGLEWLRRHQDDDGMWDTDAFMKHELAGIPTDGKGAPVHDVGVTSLALLAFLGDGSTTRSGPYRNVVEKATTWLLSQQGKNGLFGTNAAHDFIYNHVLATIAMCEAFGMSGGERLRASARAGIDYLEAHRNPDKVWRYQPKSGNNDSTVTGWAVLAYHTAQQVGLKVNSLAMQNARDWFDFVTDDTGRVGYTVPNELSSRHPGEHGRRFPPEKGEALTAIGLSSRFLLGQDPRETPMMVVAAKRILSTPPVWDEGAGSIDHYYWYHATSAMSQMGGDDWAGWSRQLAAAVLDHQRTDDNFAGSWDPVGAWGEDGGRVYSTAILVLCLEAEYRYGDVLEAVPVTPALVGIPPGPRFNQLRQAWEGRDYPRVDRAHRRLNSEDLTTGEQLILANSEAALAEEIDDAVQEVSDLQSTDDYAAAYGRLEEIEEIFKGLPPAQEASQVMRQFMRDMSIRRELNADKQLDAILKRFPPNNERFRLRLIRELESFVEKRGYRDTKAAEKATEHLKKLGRN